jgi:hypothetical protein
MTSENKENKKDEIDEFLQKEFIRYIGNNKIIIFKENNKQVENFDDFLENPEKYIKTYKANTFLLLVTFIENNDVENIKKILEKEMLNSQFYDAAIDAMLNNKDKPLNMDIVKLLYEHISVSLREFLLANLISNANDAVMVDWIFENLNEEQYLDTEKIFGMVTKMDKLMFNKLVENDMFHPLKEELFIIMFRQKNTADLYLETYKRETSENDLNNINRDKIINVVIEQILMFNNKETGKLLLDNIKLHKEDFYIWFTFGLGGQKYEMLNFIFENGFKEKFDEETLNKCLVMCESKMNIELLSYLIKNKDKFENLDLTAGEHSIMRKAIIDDKLDIVQFLLENNVYPEHSNITNNELLNDTIEFFASEEIKNTIKNFYKL